MKPGRHGSCDHRNVSTPHRHRNKKMGRPKFNVLIGSTTTAALTAPSVHGPSDYTAQNLKLYSIFTLLNTVYSHIMWFTLSTSLDSSILPDFMKFITPNSLTMQGMVIDQRVNLFFRFFLAAAQFCRHLLSIVYSSFEFLVFLGQRLFKLFDLFLHKSKATASWSQQNRN